MLWPPEMAQHFHEGGGPATMRFHVDLYPSHCVGDKIETVYFEIPEVDLEAFR